MAPNTTRPVCTLVLPGHFWPLLRALAPRLAEEIRDVMHEDDAVGPHSPRRMGGAKRYPSRSAPALMGIASLHPSDDGGLRRHVFVISRRLAERSFVASRYRRSAKRHEICVAESVACANA
jgi:hypothetical protein